MNKIKQGAQEAGLPPLLAHQPEGTLKAFRMSPDLAEQFPPEERRIITEFLRLNVRAGKMLDARPVSPLKLASDWKGALKALEGYVDSHNGKEDHILLTESLERQKELVKIVSTLDIIGSAVGGPELAALVYRLYGAGEFDKYATSHMRGVRNGLFEGGDIQRLRHVFHDVELRGGRKKFLEHAADALEENEKAMTATQVSEFLGLDAEKNIGLMNGALNVLECLGEATKLPFNSSTGGNELLWISAKSRFTRESIPTWNVKYQMLNALHRSGEVYAATLMAAPEVEAVIRTRGSYSGNKVANVLKPLDDLRYLGLVKMEKKQVQGVSRRVKCYSLTEKGAALVEETSRLGYLSEEHRRMLLSGVVEGLKPSEVDALIKVKAYLQAQMERRMVLAEGRGRGFGSIAVSKRLRSRGVDIKQADLEAKFEWQNAPFRHNLGTIVATFWKHLAPEEREMLAVLTEEGSAFPNLQPQERAEAVKSFRGMM